jgi:ribonuclease HI
MNIIFTDGSSRGNPGKGGWGAIVATPERVEEIGGREEMTTNNRMELTAAIEAIRKVSSKTKIYTDAEYVKKGITLWVKSWQKNGWRTAAKKPVLNSDLWQKLIEVTEGKDIEWILVRGHGDTAGNNRCDEIATTFADNEPTSLYSGSRAGYDIDLKVE